MAPAGTQVPVGRVWHVYNTDEDVDELVELLGLS